MTITTRLYSDDLVALDTAYNFEFRVAPAANPLADRVVRQNVLSTSEGNIVSAWGADVDGDGDNDVLSTAPQGNRLKWFRNEGSGNFTEVLIDSLSKGPNSVRTADMDADGDQDLVVAHRGDDEVVWYENDGRENFTERSISGTNNPDQPTCAIPSDLDGDGDVDVIAVAYQGQELLYYENDGRQNFTENQLNTSLNEPWSVYAADVDGDGDVDLLTATRRGDRIDWYENDGQENFIRRQIASSADDAFSVYAADLDRDGDMDVLSASSLDGTVAWYQNNGSQGFTRFKIDSTARGARWVHAADLDGDGDLDVLAAAQNDDAFTMYLNDGRQNFTEFLITDQADGASYIYPVDLTGDGRLEVIGASRLDNTLSWFAFVPEADLAVSGADSLIARGDTTPTLADSTDFGVAYVGADTVRVRYQLFNEVDDTLLLNGSPRVALSVGTAFSVATAPRDTLVPGDSTFFVLAFAPSDTGSFADTVRIESNGPAPDPFLFVVRGEGRPCPAIQANGVVTAISCADSTDGAIDLSPSGGVSRPYRHHWNTRDTTEDLSRLGPGDYTDTIIDARGCRDTFTYALLAPVPLRLQATADSVTCPGGNDGRIDLTVSGGTPGYNYQWADNATTEDRSGLDTGTYRIAITDANNCPADTAIVVGQEDLQAPVARAQNLTAQLDALGQATINAALVDDGSTDNCAIVSRSLSQSQFGCGDLGANTVTLTVEDADGNRDQATATITVEDNIAPQLTTQNITVQLDATGQATITAADVETAASDNCAIVARTLSKNTFGCGDLGPNTVSLTVEDAAATVPRQTATVTVEDTTAPQALAREHHSATGLQWAGSHHPSPNRQRRHRQLRHCHPPPEPRHLRL